jgi:hypothetical protein
MTAVQIAALAFVVLLVASGITLVVASIRADERRKAQARANRPPIVTTPQELPPPSGWIAVADDRPLSPAEYERLRQRWIAAQRDQTPRWLDQ